MVSNRQSSVKHPGVDFVTSGQLGFGMPTRPRRNDWWNDEHRMLWK